LAIKVFDIGPWNMNVSVTGTPQVNILHGLGANYTKIRSVSIIVRQDGGVGQHFDFLHSGAPSNTALINAIDATQIQVVTQAGNLFDSNSFDDVSGGYNRGWVTILYEDVDED
jgi:hypothetical protein